MRKVIISIIYSFIFCCPLFGQQAAHNILHQKGYLMFVKMNDFEQIIFLPKDNACTNYTFKKMSKIKGWLLRGADTYEMHKAKQSAKQYDVLLPRRDTNKDTTYSTPITLGVIPVELEYWETTPGKPKEDSGIPFDYKGKRYVINYIDDWDVAIDKVKIIK